MICKGKLRPQTHFSRFPYCCECKHQDLYCKSGYGGAGAEVTACSRNRLDWYLITCIQHVYVCTCVHVYVCTCVRVYVCMYVF